MTFLQPFMLVTIPLIGLPILIHLINQRRHRTKKWAAMMFLLQAKRMSKGMARLRHLLILLMRMLAVAGFVFAISRPLATGWLGLAGASSDTTIIVLDRSASMEHQDLATGASKRSTGLGKIVDLLQTLGQGTRVVLIESTANEAQELDSIDALLEIPESGRTATKADIPAMLEEAQDYMSANQTGLTDVWVCSDLQTSDWNPDGGRWKAISDTFRTTQGVRVHLLSYDRPAHDNLSVTVSNARTRRNGRTNELVLDINLKRQHTDQGIYKVPTLSLIVNGNRTVIDNIEMTENEFSLQGYTVELDKDTIKGWGKVELSQDSNPSDNSFYFVFAEPPSFQSVIVSENPEQSEYIRLAVTAPVQPNQDYQAKVISPSQLDEVIWEETALVIWQAELPNGVVGKQLENFANQGGTLLFFPPAAPHGEEFLATKWGEWNAPHAAGPTPVVQWRGDSDLLSHTQSGSALPVGEIQAFRYCSLNGDGTTLARFNGGHPMLTRINSDSGAIYFCSTLPDGAHSNLVKDGVVLYVMLQRALEKGAAALGLAKHFEAGSALASPANQWKPMAEEQQQDLPSSRPFQAGAFQNKESFIALNRPLSEDTSTRLDRNKLNELFSGIDFHVIDDQVGTGSSLASEIWKMFMIIMGVALILEAVLCLPPSKSAEVSFE